MASYHFSVKSGKKGRAEDHAKYITRKGKFSKGRNDLMGIGHGNLPTWAQGNATAFFRAADQHERANGSTYREYEASLPRELSHDQRVELIDEFIKSRLNGKPYLYAIHSERQPHVHLMTSDRKNDAIDRLPAQHFSRFNPAFPHRGGCRKDSGGKRPEKLREELIDHRAAWAEITNASLARYGHADRVDHRSHVERGLKTIAGKHLGPHRSRTVSASCA